MSTRNITLLVAVIVVLAAGYWWWSGGSFGRMTEYGGAAMSTSSPSDVSDKAINQDTAAIDAQLNAAASDSATAHSSINDKPVAQ